MTLSLLIKEAFIYSFNHYLLRRYFVSGTVLGTLDTKLNKKNQSCVGFQLFPNS